MAAISGMLFCRSNWLMIRSLEWLLLLPYFRIPAISVSVKEKTEGLTLSVLSANRFPAYRPSSSAWSMASICSASVGKKKLSC